MLFIVLLNICALLVFDPVRDPLDIENYFKDDSLLHFTLFFLSVVIGGPLLLRWFSLGIVAVGLVGFGIAAEIVQAFMEGRTADFVDFVADEAGILAGVIVIAIVRLLHRWAVPGPSQVSNSRREREESYLSDNS